METDESNTQPGGNPYRVADTTEVAPVPSHEEMMQEMHPKVEYSIIRKEWKAAICWMKRDTYRALLSAGHVTSSEGAVRKLYRAFKEMEAEGWKRT